MATTHKGKKTESDDWYFLKILCYFVLGTVWLKYNGYVVFPIGAVLAAAIVNKDHFSVDRKIEYAVLLVAAVIGLAGWGVFIPV